MKYFFFKFNLFFQNNHDDHRRKYICSSKNLKKVRKYVLFKQDIGYESQYGSTHNHKNTFTEYRVVRLTAFIPLQSQKTVFGQEVSNIHNSVTPG